MTDLRDSLEHFKAMHANACNALDALEAKNEQLEIALADAIRRPMGVIPASAEGLVGVTALDAAEARRVRVAQKKSTAALGV